MCLVSRGLNSSPFAMAVILVSGLCRQPLSLNRDLLNAAKGVCFRQRTIVLAINSSLRLLIRSGNIEIKKALSDC